MITLICSKVPVHLLFGIHLACGRQCIDFLHIGHLHLPVDGLLLLSPASASHAAHTLLESRIHPGRSAITMADLAFITIDSVTEFGSRSLKPFLGAGHGLNCLIHNVVQADSLRRCRRMVARASFIAEISWRFICEIALRCIDLDPADHFLGWPRCHERLIEFISDNHVGIIAEIFDFLRVNEGEHGLAHTSKARRRTAYSRESIRAAHLFSYQFILTVQLLKKTEDFATHLLILNFILEGFDLVVHGLLKLLDRQCFFHQLRFGNVHSWPLMAIRAYRRKSVDHAHWEPSFDSQLLRAYHLDLKASAGWCLADVWSLQTHIAGQCILPDSIWLNGFTAPEWAESI